MTALPAVPSATTGILTSTQMAQYAAVMNFLMAKPVAKLRQTVAQSIANSSFVALTFDAEDRDSAGGHDNVTNNSRYTAIYPGWYSLGGGVTFAANAAGRRLARWAVNGTLVSGSLGGQAGNASVIGWPARPDLVYLNAGDYVELTVFQDTGGALNTFVANVEYQSSAVIEWERS